MKENIESTKIELSRRRKSLLLTKFKTSAKNISPTGTFGYLVVCAKIAQMDLEKLGHHLSLPETVSLVLREFYDEMVNAIREALMSRGVSHDETNQVINWFSRLVYLVQEK